MRCLSCAYRSVDVRAVFETFTLTLRCRGCRAPVRSRTASAARSRHANAPNQWRRASSTLGWYSCWPPPACRSLLCRNVADATPARRATAQARALSRALVVYEHINSRAHVALQRVARPQHARCSRRRTSSPFYTTTASSLSTRQTHAARFEVQMSAMLTGICDCGSGNQPCPQTRTTGAAASCFP